jgi:hypothetical protein
VIPAGLCGGAGMADTSHGCEIGHSSMVSSKKKSLSRNLRSSSLLEKRSRGFCTYQRCATVFIAASQSMQCACMGEDSGINADSLSVCMWMTY